MAQADSSLDRSASVVLSTLCPYFDLLAIAERNLGLSTGYQSNLSDWAANYGTDQSAIGACSFAPGTPRYIASLSTPEPPPSLQVACGSYFGTSADIMYPRLLYVDGDPIGTDHANTSRYESPRTSSLLSMTKPGWPSVSVGTEANSNAFASSHSFQPITQTSPLDQAQAVPLALKPSDYREASTLGGSRPAAYSSLRSTTAAVSSRGPAVYSTAPDLGRVGDWPDSPSPISGGLAIAKSIQQASPPIEQAPEGARNMPGDHEIGQSPLGSSDADNGATTVRGDVFLDGLHLGRWIVDRLTATAERPRSGTTGFDPRMSITWPGAPLTI